MTREDYERAGCRVLMQDGVPLVDGVKAAPPPPEASEAERKLYKMFSATTGGIGAIEDYQQVHRQMLHPVHEAPFLHWARKMEGVASRQAFGEMQDGRHPYRQRKRRIL